MSLQVLASYKGKALLPAQIAFLNWLAEQQLQVSLTGPSEKTIRIFREGQNLGYVNGTVTERDALIGYHFRDEGRGSDSCPPEHESSVADWACNRFDCSLDDLVIHRGGGSNAHRIFLLIRTRTAATRALEVLLRPSAADPSNEPHPELEDVQRSFADAVQRSLSDSRAARLSRLALAPRQPIRVTVVTQTFARNPDVVAEVLYRAEGACEQCGKPAPFTRKSDGTPYLEVHHKIQLALGGKDMVANAVALCPNCHRQQHHGSIV